MFNSAVVIAFLSLVFLAGGCTSGRPLGVVYTKASYEIQGVGGEISDLKMGTSVAESYFGLFGFGDCSIMTAAKNAGIKHIRVVDQSCHTIFGYTTITTRVYGTSSEKEESKDDKGSRK